MGSRREGRLLKKDSLSRFIFAVLLAAVAVKMSRFEAVLVAVLISILALFYWTASFRAVLEVARRAIWFFGFVFVLHLFAHPGSKLFSILFLTATREGAVKGLFYGAKLIVFIYCAYAIMRTVDPFDLIRPVERLARLIGKGGRILSYSALSFSLALRFIPTLIRLGGDTRKALNSRGIFFEGGIAERMKAAVHLSGVLFVNALKSSETTSLALAVKGFSTRYKRAVFPRPEFSLSASLNVLIAVLIFVAGWTA